MEPQNEDNPGSVEPSQLLLPVLKRVLSGQRKKSRRQLFLVPPAGKMKTGNRWTRTILMGEPVDDVDGEPLNDDVDGDPIDETWTESLWMMVALMAYPPISILMEFNRDNQYHYYWGRSWFSLKVQFPAYI